jgi:transglutaminase-like putative cysteine protease
MIDKPVPGVQTVARAHPAGGTGARMSLKEVADRAWAARMSPRLRAWATQELAKCGASTGSRRQKMQCLLDAFRKKVPYIADPVMGEFMATPNQLLCLDEGGLCIMGGDCDEATISMVALALCIGIPAWVVGSSHKPPVDVPSHVFGAFEDDRGDKVRMDATTKLPIGQAPPRVREFWVEPGKASKDSGEGDFVGMADPGTLGDLLYPNIR